ncbi:MAG: NAD(P)H-hydrate dehydratase [Salinisphaera sp.]|jgi:hydroxyethylthiazole kinase-like uncharacterized protein yjeF|nr:NAD(P)H-hydrate dehydratase [Salinisphaera sp.]
MSETSDYLPARVYSAEQVAALDRRFIESFGVDGFTLMQRAASAGFSELAFHWPMPGRLAVLCGPGNNGGDGFLLARLALQAGWQVALMLLAERDRIVGDAGRALAAFEAAGGTVSAYRNAPVAADVIVDALLGTGLNRDVEGDFAIAIDRINEARSRGTGVFSLDIPSGIDATTGHAWGHAVQAHATITFIGLKMGILTGKGPAHCGSLSFDDLHAPDALYEDQPYVARRIDHRALRHALPARARSAHKGDNGHVLCLGGNRGMGGAIRLTAEAALRCGAGLVSVGCHRDHAGAMSQARPELMCLGLDRDDDIGPLIQAASVIAIGPGMGSDAWGASLWQSAMDSERALIVDADALNRLADHEVPRGNWILTPHPGEAARLLDCSTIDIMRDRVAAVQALAKRYQAVAVLKGAGSLVATPDELWLCTQGNPGMAVGGMGDLLTGVIAALVAQGLTLAQAAVFGVYLHALAGDSAAESGERGMLPSDLLEHLRTHANPAHA